MQHISSSHAALIPAISLAAHVGIHVYLRHDLSPHMQLPVLAILEMWGLATDMSVMESQRLDLATRTKQLEDAIYKVRTAV